eukprot:2592489-Pyramimonas_sp.AAC.1
MLEEAATPSTPAFSSYFPALPPGTLVAAHQGLPPPVVHGICITGTARGRTSSRHRGQAPFLPALSALLHIWLIYHRQAASQTYTYAHPPWGVVPIVSP